MSAWIKELLNFHLWIQSASFNLWIRYFGISKVPFEIPHNTKYLTHTLKDLSHKCIWNHSMHWSSITPVGNDFSRMSRLHQLFTNIGHMAPNICHKLLFSLEQMWSLKVKILCLNTIVETNRHAVCNFHRYWLCRIIILIIIIVYFPINHIGHQHHICNTTIITCISNTDK